MKKQFKFLFLAISLLVVKTKSQNIYTCGNTVASVSTSAIQQAGCYNYFYSFIPTPSDCVLQVSVNIFVIKPTSGAGSWGTNTIANATAAIAGINNMHANIPLPVIYTGATHISNSKIKFVLKTFSVVANDYLYDHIRSLPTNPLYNDTTAINFYFGSLDITPGLGVSNASTLPPMPSKYIFFPSTNSGSTIDYYLNYPTMAHELGHALGLDHPNIYTSVYQNLNSCCTQGIVSDLQENLASHGAIANCGTPGSSNNIMSDNVWCRQYLSPQQMGVMHYHLRNKMRSVLTPYSYSNHLNVITALNYTVSSNETWTYDRYIKGNIIIKPNVKLTISCLVGMTGLAKIIVEKKALCNIYTGTVTNISGHVWEGVQVEGDPNLNQAMNGSTGFALNQGLLQVDYAGTLSKASTAARNYITDASNNPIYSSTGGMIRCFEGVFENNARDVEFISYPNFATGSYFDRCDFKTTDKIGGPYVPYAHISLWNVFDVQFRGCNFEYASTNYYGNEGYGIHSIDASYSVDRYYPLPSNPNLFTTTTFKNLSQGVRVDNANPLYIASVNNSSFINNEVDAAYFHNMNAFTFDNNTIQTPWYPINNGLYLNTCKYYTVKNNTLLKDQNTHNMGGMYITNSQDGAHQVYRNSFSGFGTALSCHNNNSGTTNIIDGLKINCNDFTQNYNNMDVAVHGNGTGANAPTVMRTQGAIGAAANFTTVVRNKYAAPCGNASKWYTSLNNTKVVDHGTNSDAVTQPIPQTACSRTIVNVVAAPISLDYTAHCLPYLPAEGGGSNDPVLRLANINSYIRTLQAQGASVNKFELQATVASKLNWYLKDKLPGSKDTVVNLLINNRGNMKDADIQLVFAYMRKNDYVNATSKANALPVSRADWKALLLKLIAIYKEPNKIYSINTNTAAGYKTFLQGYANTAGKDGQHIAQSLLKFVSKINYTEPREYPNLAAGKEAAPNEAEGSIANALSVNYGIQLYPNPTFNGVTLVYNTEQGGQALVEVKDLLGKVIYSNFISNESNTYISLESYNSGVYLITVTMDKQVLYKTKVIKQD